MQTTAFDSSAADYDSEFTNTSIGHIQRIEVRRYTNSILNKNRALEVLEINCGTGEDAIWLSSLGYKVWACDASSKMIERAKTKAGARQTLGIDFREVAFSCLESEYAMRKYDFIFSNFGGLNCINSIELQTCLKSLQNLLKPGGKAVLVLMAPNCLWEKFYFLVKGKFNLINRRLSKGTVQAHLGHGVYQSTFFYSSQTLESLLPNKLELVCRKPIGFFVPPSYLQPFFSKKSWLLNLLAQMDTQVKNYAWLCNYADHYLLHLENKIN